MIYEEYYLTFEYMTWLSALEFFITKVPYILWIAVQTMFQQIPEWQCSSRTASLKTLSLFLLSAELFKTKICIWIFFYTSDCFTLWAFSQNTEYVSRCSVPSTWFCAFFIYAFKYDFSSVFCALLLNGGRNVFSWTSVCLCSPIYKMQLWPMRLASPYCVIKEGVKYLIMAAMWIFKKNR